MNTLDLGVAIGSGGKAIGDLDALDDQYAVLGLDLPDGFDVVAGWINFDVTRLQRAGERAGPVSPPVAATYSSVVACGGYCSGRTP
jgi:hypothetical protein